MSDQGEMGGCAQMLLGNSSFSVPTQPADGQQDTIAAMKATRRPHIQSSGSTALALAHWLVLYPLVIPVDTSLQIVSKLNLCPCFVQEFSIGSVVGNVSYENRVDCSAVWGS